MNPKTDAPGCLVNRPVRSYSIDDLPADIRHSIKTYGLNYSPLKERIEKMGVKYENSNN